MTTRKFIAIDLELEQPYTNIQTPDSVINVERIIQLGAVVFDETGILETLCYNIQYPHKLSEFISKLTGIKSETVNNSTLSLEDAVNLLKLKREEYGAERNLIQWGAGDTEAIQLEIGKPLYDFGFGRSSINVAHLFKAYSWVNDVSVKGGLKKAFNHFQLKSPAIRFDGNNLGFHNAAFDAAVTALVFNKLLEVLKRKI